MKILTKQGKEFELSDILLYKVNKKDIIVIVNDEEQMKKFSMTGRHEDAPITVLHYTDSQLTEIINSMKHIKSYNVSSDGNINVSYSDGTKVKFDITNEEIIKSNLSAQRKVAQEKAIGSWYGVSEEEKKNKRKAVQKKINKSLAAVLAATVLAGGLYSCSKLKEEKGERISKDMLNPTDPRKTEESVTTRSKLLDEAEALYQATIDVNPFILKYQQVSNVKWDKELALEVVEFINGVYPTAMTYMNEENAEKEATEIMEAISLIIAGNLNTETKEEEMIDFSQYIVNEREKVFVHNAMLMARACVNESIGEPTNGKIIDEDEWTEVNKFSMEYTNAVDQLINYEFDTINDADYLATSFGARYLISSIFTQVNNAFPGVMQTKHVTRVSSESDRREYELYYRYFLDDVRKIMYLPEEGPNGTVQYRGVWKDEKGVCHEEGPYTMDEMFAMANRELEIGKTPDMLGIEGNANIHKLGLESQLEDTLLNAKTELLESKYTYTNSK